MTPITPPAPPSNPPRTSYCYARVLAFNLQCPACGTVDAVRQVAGRRSRVKRQSHYDWLRSRWRCPSCRRWFAIGLAIWPVRRAGNRPQGGGWPVDTMPTGIQLAENLGLHGLSFSATRGWHDPVNVVCFCGDGDHVDDCPLHDSEGVVADVP